MWRAKFIGDVQLKKYYNGIKGWLNLELPDLTRKVAVQGKKYAKDIAPRDTGDLIRAIALRRKGSSRFTIVSRTPKGKNRRRIPYHVYLHAGKRGGYQGTTKSGDHQYMDTTLSHLANKYPRTVEKSLERQLNKK